MAQCTIPKSRLMSKYCSNEIKPPCHAQPRSTLAHIHILANKAKPPNPNTPPKKSVGARGRTQETFIQQTNPRALTDCMIKSDKHHGEVLIAIMNNKRDFAILHEEGWYRIPVKTAPQKMASQMARVLSNEVQFSITEEGRRILTKWLT